MDRLEGRTAFVTGAARGIGFALTEALLGAGMRVAMTDHDEAALSEAESLLDAGDRVLAMPLDVTSSDDWTQKVDMAWRELDGVQLLCNVAGIGLSWRPGAGEPQRTWEIPADRFRKIVDTNLMGTHAGVTEVLPRMLAAGRPSHILNTASMAGFVASAYLSAYSVSKYAVVALSETLAAELVDSCVGISLLAPGGVATPFNESARRQLGTGTASAARTTGESDATKMHPRSVADRALEGIVAGDFYVFTHPEYAPLLTERHRGIEGSFGPSAQPGYSDPAALLERAGSHLGLLRPRRPRA